ncbi:MAG: LysR family transcriptional regulator [Clostridia bacterium]|nr:LysR family transcriptional regulator [Clostridia bacterium]
MDFKQLTSFVTVVNCRSFSKAAQQLFISQPSISTHIQHLEEELGNSLLSRNAKTIEMTPAGAEFYEYASNILQIRDKMVVCCGVEAGKQIHLGASTIPSAYLLPEICAAFSRKHPDASFSIVQNDSRKITEGIIEKRFDLGFVGTKAQNPDLSFTPFFEDRIVLITPATETFRKIFADEDSSREHSSVSGTFPAIATIPTLKKLLSFPLIIREEGSGTGNQLQKLLSYTEIPQSELHVIAKINDHEAIKNMVGNGMGVACVSNLALNASDLGKLFVCPLPEEVSKRQLYLVQRKNTSLHGYAQLFRNFAAAGRLSQDR